MDMLFAISPGILLAFIGWAATYKLISDTVDLSLIQKRALNIFTLLLWMVPAFDVTVYQGLMQSDVAVTCCGTITLVFGALMP
jgi:hypothetical protein